MIESTSHAKFMALNRNTQAQWDLHETENMFNAKDLIKDDQLQMWQLSVNKCKLKIEKFDTKFIT